MLTKEQLQAIKKLQTECEQEDSIQLKLNWDMLHQRNDGSMDFFYEEEGELIAYLALYGFGSTVEVCGMVKPIERRKQYFSKLWQQALQVIQEKGFQKILLNAPATSESAKKWLATQSCSYVFSEHEMKWKEKPLEASTEIILRHSLPSDASFEIQLDVISFNMRQDDAQQHYDDCRAIPEEQHFIITAEGNDIGKIRISTTDREAYLYGFAILPEFRGKGYGGKALRNIVKQQHEAGNSIGLDVEAKNNHALQLYEKVGFTIIHAQDYYLWN